MTLAPWMPGGPSWLPQGQRNDPFGMTQPQAAPNGIQGLLKDPNFALALLANSRGQRFGQALGTAGLQASQMGQQRQDDALRQEYMKAQIASMGRGPQRKPVVVAGPDGKPIYVDEQEAIGKSPFLTAQDGVGDYQPGDYTPKSWAAFLANGKKDPSVLERYVAPRQETSKPFQNITRTYPDGSTQQGTFDTRTGEFFPSGPVLPAGIKPRVDAQGKKEGEIAGERNAKSPRAYETFKVGMFGLENAMSGTETGPLVGRIPAVTAPQQIAEGAENAMAPVLKQLFRDSGEGVFTDRDQEILMKMVPNRKDHPEARRAKMEMIDSIVRAKLGMSGQENSGAPEVGTIQDGYRFNGGNPADPKSWVKQ